MEDHKPLRVGLAGLGVVGVGVAELLTRNGSLIAARAGRPIEVVAVTARRRARDRGFDLTQIPWVDSAVELARDGDIDVFVELIGGSEGVAREAVEAALGRARPVVTANKALLAHHGATLARMAETRGVTLAFEAAVGGIPVIKALREGLAGNRLTRIYGILNGTSNYILSKMRQGRDFADVLADAQKLGYAEADPAFDVEGIDAAHKLAILAAVAFGSEIAFDKVHIEGIRHISSLDIAFADELGYRIKLLGIATQTGAGLEQRVHPCMVPSDHAIALVEEVHNAIVIEGDSVGDAMLVGRGAGAGPTASAVVADLIDLARGVTVPTFAIPANNREPLPSLSIDRHRGAYYVRLMVQDQPGVIADVASALRNENVSMEAMIQHGRNPGESVPVVLTTHETEEAAMRRALSRIALLPAVLEAPRLIRIMEQVPGR